MKLIELVALEFAYQEIIDNSLFPIEKKKFENGLKRMKMNLIEFIRFVYLVSQECSTNDPFQIDFINLPKSKLLHDFSNKISSGEINGDKLRDVHDIFNRINFLYWQGIEKIDKEAYNTQVQIKNNYVNQLKERFFISENFQSKIKIDNDSTKGYHSFQMKIPKNEKFVDKVWRFLIDNKFIVEGTKLIYFKKIFSGDVIIPKEKINWNGSYRELYYFAKLLGEKIKNTDDKFHTATHCFYKGKKDISITQLTKSNGSKINFDKIKEAIDLFE